LISYVAFWDFASDVKINGFWDFSSFWVAYVGSVKGRGVVSEELIKNVKERIFY